MNSTNGQLTYPATMAAMHILDHGDTFLSHKTTVYYHKAFSTHWMAEDEFDHHVPCDLVGEEHAKPWTCVDDYLHRPEELEEFSPTLLHMFYEKKPKDQYLGADNSDHRSGTLQRLPLPPTHPQAASHMLIARRNPVLLQFIGTPPTQPSDNAQEDDLQR